MGEPQYRLEGIVHTKSDVLEDFEGPTALWTSSSCC